MEEDLQGLRQNVEGRFPVLEEQQQVLFRRVEESLNVEERRDAQFKSLRERAMSHSQSHRSGLFPALRAGKPETVAARGRRAGYSTVIAPRALSGPPTWGAQ